jgi:carbamoyl-phosphate synthase large subunit
MKFHATGTKIFMPDHDVLILVCMKYKTLKLKRQVLRECLLIYFINNEEDLRNAFTELGDEDGKIWLH